MPFVNTNTHSSVSTRSGNKACTPFKPNSNTNSVNSVRKPNAGLKVVTTSTSTGVVAASVNATPSVASTTYPSDEENVRPAPTVPPTGAASQEHGQAPLSPRPLSPQLKDVRAYEHERQRSKRAGEWAVRRARKAGVGAKGPLAGAGPGVGVGARKSSRANRDREEEVDGEYVVGGRVPGVGFPSVLARGANEGRGEVVQRSKLPTSTAKVDVSLEELVVPARPKPKFRTLGLSTKGLEDDEEFEWVPALRAVIALDEEELGRRDMEVDEPWECVDGEGEGVSKEGKEERVNLKGRREKELSYAAVLSGMHVE